MSTQALFASTSFTCRDKELAELGALKQALAEIASAVTPMRLSHTYATTTSGGVGRGTLLQDASQVRSKLFRSTTNSLCLISQDPNSPVNTDSFASVSLRRLAEPLESEGTHRGVGEVALTRTLRASDTRAFLTGLQRVFSLVNAPSGHVHIATEWTLALSETGFQAVAPHRPTSRSEQDGSVDSFSHSWLLWKHEEDTNDRVEALTRVRSAVGARLRGTYWGTFLGREMVAELGGAERIMREAPVHLVEPFGDGALYLQLTPEPEPITTPAMQTGLLALEQFLQPVLVPLPPYWATRAARAAQQAAASGGTTPPT